MSPGADRALRALLPVGRLVWLEGQLCLDTMTGRLVVVVDPTLNDFEALIDDPAFTPEQNERAFMAILAMGKA